MKTNLLATLGFLALITVGCNVPDADFVTAFAVVKEKSQNDDQQKNHEALYTIRSYDKENARYSSSVKLLLPEDFAKVNQHLYFDGTNMYAGPMELETNTKR